MDKQEKKAMEISNNGTDAIKSFLIGFSKFVEEKNELCKKEVLELYSKMNSATLIYNAIILEEEIKKRTKDNKNKQKPKEVGDENVAN